MKKKQIALERKYISETQNRINKIEKENLKKEIESKRKELLNTTDAAIRKNESIMILRNELKRFVEISPKKSVKTKKILEIAEKNIFNNRDWEIFESNFNELNQDFFKKLTDIQPKLTKKDLRLCAYVKTGLTSKKIAPLMGISVRGVELHRYRLGKKLNITIEETLAKFLLKF
ncbi:helix-turn-helix transcriptional regulator [Polaribacter sp. HL-MS24]|uniref:helix-turn-helix transcriptional regulator n=1 Tax=Polaribacter sp. HL-MS24 TaxID=3077735 RepID=UPI00293410D2|nr:LuxR C-terminal-related transcriptional regulator [Polaribacter sp. HL-MS24]WOC40887.1 LuxR C-terminal-related transcriptional regulator [Polaribacter sp. HL-MS24]